MSEKNILNEDDKVSIYNNGYKAGQKHQAPSPETKQAISNLTMELKFIKEDIKGIKETVNKLPTIAEMNLANRQIVEEMYEKVKCDFTTKEEFTPVRKIVFGLVGAVMLAVVAGVLTLVLK